MNKEKEIRLDAVLKSLYESISFNAGSKPDFDKLKLLFIDGARLIRTDKENITNMSVDDFINSYEERINNGQIKAFTEYEINRKVDEFGRIVQAFSTYGTKMETNDGIINMRGINSLQLIEIENNWKVATILWYAEDEENKIPERYLTK